MANLIEQSQWELNVYQLETDDPVLGGADGIDNRQAKQLANRTQYLKEQVELRPTVSEVATQIAALVNAAPVALDTLNELAAALGNDANFATTITNALALKAPINSPVFTGDPKAPTAAFGDNDTSIANTAFVQAAIAALQTRGYMLIQDQKASGIAGGTSVVGIQTRVLNTVVKNTITGASLSGNQFTLPAGNYMVNARAPVFYSQHRCQIFNVTDNVVHIYGSNANGLNSANAAGDPVQTESFITAYIELLVPKVFSLRSYCSEANATNGLGQSSTEALGNEIYSSIEIIKD